MQMLWNMDVAQMAERNIVFQEDEVYSGGFRGVWGDEGNWVLGIGPDYAALINWS